uniref:Uncharacterized protein n=1 Tax=Trichuris muris TaxID=70415 RepID=A0A5S6QE46_TRIMR
MFTEVHQSGLHPGEIAATLDGPPAEGAGRACYQTLKNVICAGKWPSNQCWHNDPFDASCQSGSALRDACLPSVTLQKPPLVFRWQ